MQRDDLDDLSEEAVNFVRAPGEIMTALINQTSSKKTLECLAPHLLTLAKFPSGYKDTDNETLAYERRKHQEYVLEFCAKITDKPDLLDTFFDDIAHWFRIGDKSLHMQRLAIQKAMEIFEKCPVLIAKHLKFFLDLMKDTKFNEHERNYKYFISGAMKEVIKVAPDAFDDFISDLTVFMDSADAALGIQMGHALGLVADIQNKSKLFTSVDVGRICACMRRQPNAVGYGLYVLDKLAVGNPSVVAPHWGIFRDIRQLFPACFSYALYILGKVAVNIKKIQPDTVRFLDGLVTSKSLTDVEARVAALSVLKNLALEDKGLVAPGKRTYVNVSADPLYREAASALLDVIAGRTLTGLAQDATGQRQDLNVVQAEVTDAGGKVTNVKEKTSQNQKNIGKASKDVKATKQQVAQVKTDLKKAKIKVEEVSHKTMSNAPAWSRDVTLLLNPEADADWRLLAQRLAYTQADIKAWGAQHDPCMAVLSEWYETHRAVEATHAVLKALEEMNREDAAAIVRDALRNMENLVEDGDKPSGPLPPIFLSYQWGHQPHAKLLRQHLEWAGYQCWMDLGQMGGGDKLFEKIDAGMRAAKVVVCCVTDKYAKSNNCNREVNLAVTLGKPMIPLLMEEISWPPAGSMGPIFGEYLFIRFFARQDEPTLDKCFWLTPKFTELLMQLRHHVAPEQVLVTEPYTRWWQTDEQELEISTSSSASQTDKMPRKPQELDSTSNPEVSYKQVPAQPTETPVITQDGKTKPSSSDSPAQLEEVEQGKKTKSSTCVLT